MSLQRNYYEVLGIPSGATTDQIKKKYRELARQFHPDVAQDKTLAQRTFTQINQAYSVLGDPERRAQYNGTLSQDTSAAPQSSVPTQSSPPAQSNGATSAVSNPAPAAPNPAPAAPSPSLSAHRAQAATEMLSRAENAIMGGKPIEARALCMRVLETDPRHVRALEILGDALVQMGRREEAAVQYRRALQVAPSTLIQAKLNRAAQSAPSTRTMPPHQAPPATRTVPPSQAPPAQSGNGAQRTNPPAEADTEKPGGLLGRLLGRK